METKTHYRKVYKSDHLGCADIEDFIEAKKPLVFKIKEVKQEIGILVAGKRGDHNIAYFYEKIKPLVLNATNAKVVKTLSAGSPFIEDWKDILVEAYIDEKVKMKGEVVGGVRLKAHTPAVKIDNTGAIKLIKESGSLLELESNYKSLSPELKSDMEVRTLTASLKEKMSLTDLYLTKKDKIKVSDQRNAERILGINPVGGGETESYAKLKQELEKL